MTDQLPVRYVVAGLENYQPDQPPAPGPIWTNGTADVDYEIDLGYQPHHLEQARHTLADVISTHGTRWLVWVSAYIVANTHREPMQPHQHAMAAALAELEEWPDTHERY